MIVRWFHALFALGVVVATVGPFTGGAHADREPAYGPHGHADIEALLVGNSYSNYNDLPRMLERVAESVPDGPSLHADLAFKAGVGLRSHWERGRARRLLRQGDYTHVVLQGHSRAVFDAPREFLHYAQRFEHAIEGTGAQAVLFATWPRHPSSSLYALGKDAHTPLEMQTRIDDLYSRAAKRSGAAVAPVGDAWLLAMARWPHLQLHRPDASHPTEQGTYLTACVLYGALAERSPKEIQLELPVFEPSGLARLRSVAAAALGLEDPEPHMQVAEGEKADALDAPGRGTPETGRSLDAPLTP